MMASGVFVGIASLAFSFARQEWREQSIESIQLVQHVSVDGLYGL